VRLFFVLFALFAGSPAFAQDPLARCVSDANEAATLQQAKDAGYTVRELDAVASKRFIDTIRKGNGAQLTGTAVIGLTRDIETIVLVRDGADLCSMPAVTTERFEALAKSVESGAI
jgi:hypothetical protein